MIRPLQFLRLLAVAVSALLASACIDSREEVWIRPDGSGRAEIRVELPTHATRLHGGAEGVRGWIESFLSSEPDLETEKLSVLSSGGRTTIDIAVRFRSALSVAGMTSGGAMDDLPPAARAFAGTVESHIRGRTMEYQRSIAPGTAFPGVAWIPASRWEGRTLEYIIHLPAAAQSSNATLVTDGGRTLVWNIPLSEAVKQPFHTRFQMELPIPWRTVSAVAIPLSLAGGWLLLRRVRKPAAAPADD